MSFDRNHKDQRDPAHTTTTSVYGAINMLGLAKRPRAPIFRASTSEVYGAPLTHPKVASVGGLNATIAGFKHALERA